MLSTGDVSVLAPSFSWTPTLVTQIPRISDTDLLDVANSVPGMIGQSFSVSSINDVVIIEFNFVPSCDTVSFDYLFGSQEYFGYENSSFNDVFGFFISGPGITSVLYKELIYPQIITSVDSVLCPVDPIVELFATPEGGVWHGNGVVLAIISTL